jgi:hypothetical protein
MIQDVDQLPMLIVNSFDIDAKVGRPLEENYIVRHMHSNK